MDTILNNPTNGYIPPQKQMTQTKKLHASQVYNDEEQEEEDQRAADSADGMGDAKRNKDKEDNGEDHQSGIECVSKSDTRGQGHDEWYKNFRYFTSRLLQLGKETNDTRALSSQLATTQKNNRSALTIHHKT
eukprot:108972_1